MIKSLTTIISHFPSATNRARCTTHIMNLVSNIILCQFDAKKKPKEPKKTSENANDNTNEPKPTMDVTELDNEDDITSLAEGLNREEQELADDEDEEMNENVAADLEEIEEAMKEEVLEVAKKVKPIQRVLFKVRLNSLTFLFMWFYNYYSLFSMYLCLGFFYYQLWKLAYAIKRSTTILLP